MICFCDYFLIFFRIKVGLGSFCEAVLVGEVYFFFKILPSGLYYAVMCLCLCVYIHRRRTFGWSKLDVCVFFSGWEMTIFFRIFDM